MWGEGVGASIVSHIKVKGSMGILGAVFRVLLLE